MGRQVKSVFWERILFFGGNRSACICTLESSNSVCRFKESLNHWRWCIVWPILLVLFFFLEKENETSFILAEQESKCLPC